MQRSHHPSLSERRNVVHTETQATTQAPTAQLDQMRPRVPVYNVSQQHRRLDEDGTFHFRGTSRKANHFCIYHVNGRFQFQRDMPINVTAHWEKTNTNTGAMEDLGNQTFEIPVDRYSYTDVGNWFDENDFADDNHIDELTGERRFRVKVDIPPDDLPLANNEENSSQQCYAEFNRR